MIRFECDYGEGAARPVLDLLQKTNLEQDPRLRRGRLLRRRGQQDPHACATRRTPPCTFSWGATQANLTVIDAALKPWQGVLCAESGHIHVHETGAVEATGHKCLPPARRRGQDHGSPGARRRGGAPRHPPLTSMKSSRAWCTSPTPTEVGHAVLQGGTDRTFGASATTWGLYLFVDGARMAYGLQPAPATT